jgi:hypothetical protein
MSELFKIFSWAWEHEPRVAIACVMILAVIQNKYPHPECEWGEKNYNMLCKELKKQHRENREDHQTLFALIRGENPKPIRALPPYDENNKDE